MNMRKFLKTTLAIILIAGAGIIVYNIQKTETLSEQACDNVEIIDYAHAEIKGMSEIPDTLLGDKKYIFLDNGNSDTFVSMITKVAMTDNRIYVLDPKLSKVVVFDSKGKGVGQVGCRGQGKSEYVSITDFCLSDNGDIYLIDGVQKKLLVFDSRLRFKESKMLPFDAEAISVLQDGNILWGLCPWNLGKCSGKKIAVTDKNLNVMEGLIDFDEYTDPSYIFSFIKIIETDVCLSYNREIDSHIYVFNKNGTLRQVLLFDFGDMDVPDEKKKNIEKNLRDFERYCCLISFAAVTDRIVAGQLKKFGKTVPFIYDRLHNVSYEGEGHDIPTYTTATDYEKSYWITYLDAVTDNRQYVVPDSVNEYLKNEGMVLCLQKLE